MMGFNTAMIVLNDTVHQIRNDPKVGEAIYLGAINAERGQYMPHGLQTLPSCHADTMQIIALGGNTLRAIGYGRWDDDDETLLRRLANKLGYRIVRKASKP